MIRQTPIKNKIYKTEVYKKHKKLIYKLAHDSVSAVELDYDDLVSELNLVFCKCIRYYIPSKGCFSTFLYKCCKTHIANIIRIQNEPKRNKTDILDIPINYIAHPITTEDRYIILNNFINNKNKIIQMIAGIIGTYKLPNTNIKNWIQSVLKSYGYKQIEIKKAFQIIKTLY